MIQRISIETYLENRPELPLIDVRTPAEYESGHIPGAENIALFSNEERARVGTIYKKKSKELAYDIGAEFVVPKLDHFIEESKKIAIDDKVVVYCWRGGMRSKLFAEHIELSGIKEVYVIEGGYKAFRTYALDSFLKPGELYILGGYTGSGKTKILRHLKSKGQQVIDLEAIANHKGSAFGSIGQDEQPKNEHFTNLLFWHWKELDYSRPVWLEDESIHIGKVYIPEVLFQRMRDVTVYFLDIPKEERAKFLVEDYVGVNKEPLVVSINKISKRLGGVKTAEALESLARNDYYSTAIITLNYYDKFYLKGVNQREKDRVVVVKTGTVDAEKNAHLLLDYIR